MKIRATLDPETMQIGWIVMVTILTILRNHVTKVHLHTTLNKSEMYICIFHIVDD